MSEQVIESNNHQPKISGTSGTITVGDGPSFIVNSWEIFTKPIPAQTAEAELQAAIDWLMELEAAQLANGR